jgi:hypothetical protein
MSDITASFPFDGDDDQTNAIAYSDAFYLIFYVSSAWLLMDTAEVHPKVTFFTFGRKLAAMDFVGPDVDDEAAQPPPLAKLWDLITKCLRWVEGFIP